MFVIPFMQPFGTHPFGTKFGIVPCGMFKTWFAKQVQSNKFSAKQHPEQRQHRQKPLH